MEKLMMFFFLEKILSYSVNLKSEFVIVYTSNNAQIEVKNIIMKRNIS